MAGFWASSKDFDTAYEEKWSLSAFGNPNKANTLNDRSIETC